ncbi:MAG: hypothetical protein ACQEUT_18380 [Bacillota bacterium]
MKMLFNRNGYKLGNTIEQPSEELVKNTLGLWNASLEDAIKYGGDLTKECLSAMDLRMDKKYVVVDSRVTMLLPGFYPSIPGYHVDGTPRGKELRPEVKASPNIQAQEEMDSPRYHLIVTGEASLTRFIDKKIELNVPDVPSTKLFKMVDAQTKEMIGNGQIKQNEIFTAPSCTAVEFDWWELHSAVAATKPEWRFLIRVTETDYLQPQRNLRKIIRTQQNVYVPENFGW